MDYQKIVRTVCLFRAQPSAADVEKLAGLAGRLENQGFEIQTQRLCSPDVEGVFRLDAEGDGGLFLSLGRRGPQEAADLLPRVLAAKNVAFNLDLTDTPVDETHVGILFEITQRNPAKTFNFTYTFATPASSPFFPSASYERNGFAIGLQPTNLAAGCDSVQAWLERMQAVWEEIEAFLSSEAGYLGIDTSVAPLFEGDGSFLHFLNRLGIGLEGAATSDVFLRITDFLKRPGVRKTGLCGLMFPCLEDFELARAYESGGFSLERNVFLSLHSGLGIDAYPIGVDEDPGRVLEVLRLVQGLSRKYQKPLSVRFVSDGQARIGDMAAFGNPYLKDVRIRPI